MAIENQRSELIQFQEVDEAGEPLSEAEVPAEEGRRIYSPWLIALWALDCLLIPLTVFGLTASFTLQAVTVDPSYQIYSPDEGRVIPLPWIINYASLGAPLLTATPIALAITFAAHFLRQPNIRQPKR
ncbi:hypothetical protein FHU41_000244 [Psychromicrobium silvestre]|uniref:Uncharacterized protein n=1 Tax=Psychromicrobium silvestre TaxID=1645614 RepID=A0A7Y9S3S2_9MICC|nr:hypothetical protein [Psychromicrobium silvestre]NYE94023.1 hypothetical protein [Psychromicrobium silvestre]